MSDKIYKKIKRQNGEQFARTLRDHHNGLLEIEGIIDIVKHAGRNAESLLPYLMSLLASNDDIAPAPELRNPFELLSEAGYVAFHADTLEKQNSIASHFKKGELLCTFNDRSRYKKYHIIHAVKKDVDNILRDAFNGKEKRQDEYGTSVISIQILKKGGFISIKNRYNHTVRGCDNTFNSNPDNIIEGLSQSLKTHFKVDFSAKKSPLPHEYEIINGKIFKYHTEKNGYYYGDQAWAKDGVIHTVNKSAGNALFERFLFDNKTKTLKKIDPDLKDSFADDFNRDYGGRHDLTVQKGNLMLGDHMLIGADQSRLKTLDLPELTEMSNDCLKLTAKKLVSFKAPALIMMGNTCLFEVNSLTQFKALALTTMGDACLYRVNALTQFDAPALITMGNKCLASAKALAQLDTPALTTMGDECLYEANALTRFEAPKLNTMGDFSLCDVNALREIDAPALATIGRYSLYSALTLRRLQIKCSVRINRLKQDFNIATKKMRRTFTRRPRISKNRKI